MKKKIKKRVIVMGVSSIFLKGHNIETNRNGQSRMIH